MENLLCIAAFVVESYPTNSIGIISCCPENNKKEKKSNKLSARKAAFFKGAKSAALRVPAENPLCHQGRYSDEKHDQQIKKNKRSTSEFPIRRPPLNPNTYLINPSFL